MNNEKKCIGRHQPCLRRKILQSFVSTPTSTQHGIIYLAGRWKIDDRARWWQSDAEAPYRSTLLYLSTALEPVSVARQYRQYRIPAYLSSNVSNLKRYRNSLKVTSRHLINFTVVLPHNCGRYLPVVEAAECASCRLRRVR